MSGRKNSEQKSIPHEERKEEKKEDRRGKDGPGGCR